MKTTPKHFQLFKKECAEWIDAFGLYDWSITYEHGSGGEVRDRNVIGWVEADVLNRVGVINLSTDWMERPTNRAVRKVALHEVLELLLYRFRWLDGLRYNLAQGDVEEEIHTIIRRLEKVLWEG